MEEKQTEVKDQTNQIAQPESEAAPEVKTETGEGEKSFKDKVLSVIKDKLGLGSDEGITETQEEVPTEFVDAAIDALWLDEDILSFVKGKTKEELLELVPYITKEKVQTETETGKDTKEDTEKQPDEVDVLLDKLLSHPKLQEKLGEKLGLTKVQNLVEKLETEKNQTDAVKLLATADKMMDEYGKEFKELGLKKDMPLFPAGPMKGQPIPTSPQFKARAELYGFAVPFMQAGQSIEEAMSNANFAYRGKYMKENVERDLIKDLKKHETKLSGPRTAKEVKKTYSNDREEGIATIRDILGSQGQGG